MSKPKLLDLFCGAGGASMGYHRAGFDVTGVDKFPQKRYPFQFYEADALDFLCKLGDQFDVIHASPPCQHASIMTRGRWKDREHPRLIDPVRRLLISIGRPYIIENVVGADLNDPFMLCGTMFSLQTSFEAQLRRHRLFEAPWFSGDVPLCRHNNIPCIGVHGGGQHPSRRRRNPSAWADPYDYGIVERRNAMGIQWMVGKELNQAIPPAYTEFIGRALLRHMGRSDDR